MSGFEAHFKMDEHAVKTYVKEKLDLFPSEAELQAEEIGDGNINYVFRVSDKIGTSVVIKQADVELRTNPGRRLDLDRNRIEADIMLSYQKQAPEFVPEIYYYDPVMCSLAMEDISDHGNLRYELLKGKTFPYFSEHISSFLVNTLLPSTDIVMDRWEKKRQVKKYVNIELCDISEKLVFSEPYTDQESTNIILDQNKSFVEEQVYDDERLILEAGKLKYSFMNNAQSLLHGDLHTGSIFVTENSTKIIDPEFAFYGPMGYDIGNVVGNLFFPWISTYMTKSAGGEKKAFLDYIENTIVDTVDLFKAKFRQLYPKIVTDVMAQQAGYMEWFLKTVLEDTCGFAGTEIIRRTIGDAKVADITGISNVDCRIETERALIMLAKILIKERAGIKEGSDYIDALRKVMNL